MKYSHIVIKDGVWYPAGAEVPGDTKTQKKEPEQKQYTKTDINRMSTAELQLLAVEVGIENAPESSGGELKKLLIEHFGL